MGVSLTAGYVYSQRKFFISDFSYGTVSDVVYVRASMQYHAVNCSMPAGLADPVQFSGVYICVCVRVSSV